MPNWNNLETFAILSETLNFSKTARILNTAQPAISRKIKLLEEEVGYALFIRNKKRVSLSNEGQELKRKLNPLVEEIKRIFLENEKQAAHAEVIIRVGSLIEAGQIMLYPRIAKYLEKNSHVKIHTTLTSSASVNADVLAGLLDFGFVYSLSDHKTVKNFAVVQDMAVLVADKKTAQRWREKEKISIVGYREGDPYTKSFVERNFTKAEQKKVVLGPSFSSHLQIIDLAKKMKAFAVLPRSSVQKFADQGEVEILLQDRKAENLFIICHEQTLIDKRKKAFLEHLLQSFKND